MKSEDFVEKLKLVAPSREKLVELDCDEEFIDIYIKSFSFKKVTDKSVSSNPILDLIFKYSVDEFEVSMIRFNSKEDVTDVEKYIFFGSFDADLLAIDTNSKEIVLIDWDAPDKILFPVAKDSSSFLNCILKLADFNKEMFFNEELSNDQKEILKRAIMISEIAGGEKYLNFFMGALGFDETSDINLN